MQSTHWRAGAPEIHVSRLLSQHAQSLKGMEAYCFMLLK